jgi:hypothetical protein
VAIWIAGGLRLGSLIQVRGLLADRIGAVAQLGEHLLCKQGVSGSIPLSSTIPALWTSAFGVEVGGLIALSFEKNKVCIGLTGLDACSDYIVKRRYVWKLPGVEDGREAVFDVRAQSHRNHGWSSRSDMVEGLEVGRKLVTQGMFVVGDLNHRNFEAFKASGILVFPVISDGMLMDVAWPRIPGQISRSWS